MWKISTVGGGERTNGEISFTPFFIDSAIYNTFFFFFFKIKLKVLFNLWRVTDRGSRLSDATAMLTVPGLLLYAVRDVV